MISEQSKKEDSRGK